MTTFTAVCLALITVFVVLAIVFVHWGIMEKRRSRALKTLQKECADALRDLEAARQAVHVPFAASELRSEIKSAEVKPPVVGLKAIPADAPLRPRPRR